MTAFKTAPKYGCFGLTSPGEGGQFPGRYEVIDG